MLMPGLKKYFHMYIFCLFLTSYCVYLGNREKLETYYTKNDRLF